MRQVIELPRVWPPTGPECVHDATIKQAHLFWFTFVKVSSRRGTSSKKQVTETKTLRACAVRNHLCYDRDRSIAARCWAQGLTRESNETNTSISDSGRNASSSFGYQRQSRRPCLRRGICRSIQPRRVSFRRASRAIITSALQQDVSIDGGPPVSDILVFLTPA